MCFHLDDNRHGETHDRKTPISSPFSCRTVSPWRRRSRLTQTPSGTRCFQRAPAACRCRAAVRPITGAPLHLRHLSAPPLPPAAPPGRIKPADGPPTQKRGPIVRRRRHGGGALALQGERGTFLAARAETVAPSRGRTAIFAPCEPAVATPAGCWPDGGSIGDRRWQRRCGSGDDRAAAGTLHRGQTMSEFGAAE